MTDAEFIGLAIGAAVVVVLFVYLGYALIRPERF
jgi:K+-transporting ATPase KdpF subunit